jgi:hypothetical protein
MERNIPHMMGNEDFRKWFEDMFNKGTLANTTSLEQFNKQIEQFNTQARTSWEKLLSLLQTSYLDVNEKTIETNTPNGPNYKTTIKIDGDVRNEFPTPASDTNNAYWTRHNQLVDEAVALQKEIIIKVIDTIATTLQKVVNPISISSSDVVNLMSLFKKT